MSNIMPNEADRAFIDDMAGLLTPWGVPQTAARLYGYLLLSAEPASLDRVAADLGMSKSSASVAARLLEQYTLVRRRGETGTKRAFYEVSDNYEGILIGQTRLIAALTGLLRRHAESDAAPGSSRNRLAEMADFYAMIGEATEQAFERWKRRGPD